MSARLRRLLRPLYPVLRPIWHRVQPILAGETPRSLPVVLERWRARRQDSLRRMRNIPDPPIRPLRNYELIDLGVAEPYYRPRRGYMNAAGLVASDLIERKELRTALELGPHLRSLIVGADVMDVVRNERLRAEGRRSSTMRRRRPGRSRTRRTTCSSPSRSSSISGRASRRRSSRSAGSPGTPSCRSRSTG